LTQSNDPLSTNEINSHFVNQTSSQNDMVQIDYLIMFASPNQFVQIDNVIFLKPIILEIFLLENPVKETMNYNSACEYVMHLSIFMFFSQFFMYILQLQLNHSFNN
jgi:hypothetical protein